MERNKKRCTEEEEGEGNAPTRKSSLLLPLFDLSMRRLKGEKKVKRRGQE